jgi:hypothetical protein
VAAHEATQLSITLARPFLHPRDTNAEPVAGALTLSDPLACVYYLRLCAKVASAPSGGRLSEGVKENFLRVLAKSVADPRYVVTPPSPPCLLRRSLWPTCAGMPIAREGRPEATIYHGVYLWAPLSDAASRHLGPGSA